MSQIAAIGISFRDVPTAVRSRAALPLDEDLLRQLRQQGMTGVVAVHTCARSLWLISAENAEWTSALLQAMVARRLNTGPGPMLPHLWTGRLALHYALRVSVGLDSHVQGEADIGRQVSGAFAQAHSEGNADGPLHLLQQSIHRLLARGRSMGFIRQNRGLGQLAVEALDRAGLPPQATVGVIGTGAIGRRVMASLHRVGRPYVPFNRSESANSLPLSSLPEHKLDAMVVCTAGPSGWLRPPAGPLVVDLGLPAQVSAEVASVGLDQLLQGDTLRLPAGRVELAEQVVDQELEVLLLRLTASAQQRSLSRLNEARDRFLEHSLPELLAPSLGSLAEEDRRRVQAAVKGLLRQYSHSLLTTLKEDFSQMENP